MDKEFLKSPKYAERILKFFLPQKEKEFLLGDYNFLFNEVSEKRGSLFAVIWYWMIVLREIPGFINHKVFWGVVMFKSNMKLAFRNIVKQKLYSFINIFGLATGIACSLLIFGYVQNELSYDRFQENAENLYIATFDNGSTTTPTALAGYLKSEYPQVVKATRWTSLDHSLITSENTKAFQDGGAVVDPDFISMFSIKLVNGNADRVLDKPRSILISKSMAAKYFGSENPVGKTLTYENEYKFLVTGVFDDYAENSHLVCTFLISNSFLKELGRDMNVWEYNNIQTYVQLNPKASVVAFNKEISNVIERHRVADKRALFIQPITQLHLNPFNREGGSITYVYMFSILAMLILVIACINFINLTTAKASVRSREVGIRKTIGATRRELISQFFGESLSLTLISFFLALFIVAAILPLFNELASKNFTLGFIFKQDMAYGIFGILFFTGLFAGSYPALFLSRFQPSKVLKNDITMGKRKFNFRHALVVTQFIASTLLIIFSLVVFEQVDYLQNHSVGFDKENLVYFQIGDKFKQNYETVKREMLTNPNISSITLMDCPPYQWIANAGYGVVKWEGQTNQLVKMVMMSVDDDYLETLELKMAKGRFFSSEYSTDAKDAYVINEAAAKAMEMNDPIGKWLRLGGDERRIIGVVKDFHFESLKREIIPAAMRIAPDWYFNACVKISSNNIGATLSFIQDKWEEIYPDYPFEYHFLDETLRSRYQSEQVTGMIVFSFTVLALIISCLGLFGLSSYTAERKTKEIGVRKVLGASSLSIVTKISREFVLLVLIANIIAWPISYYFVQKWLQNFAFRAPIDPLLFIYTLLAAVVIAVVTISWQIINAARKKTVDSLKYE